MHLKKEKRVKVYIGRSWEGKSRWSGGQGLVGKDGRVEHEHIW